MCMYACKRKKEMKIIFICMYVCIYITRFLFFLFLPYVVSLSQFSSVSVLKGVGISMYVYM